MVEFTEKVVQRRTHILQERKISDHANIGWKCYNCHKFNKVVDNLCCKHCDRGLNKFYFFILNERNPKEYHDFICNKKLGLIKGWDTHV